MNCERKMRGRPPSARLRVQDELSDCHERGERLSLAELSRRCKLNSYRDAKRILRDLVVMGWLGQ